MLNAEFAKLIIQAHELEQEFIEILKQPGDIVHIPPRDSKFSDYDFSINDIKYEVKLDNNLYKYKTLFIEFESNKKPSGISITKADYYCIKAGDDMFIIPVEYIKELLNNNIFNIRNCGYKMLSKCHLIPLKFIIKYKLINEIEM